MPEELNDPIADAPFAPFRFRVRLLDEAGALPESPRELCRAAFSEVTGIEATMTPKKIVEGGRNDAEIHRAGPTSHSVVTLKRGFVRAGDLWTWWDAVVRGGRPDARLTVVIEIRAGADDDAAPRVVVRLSRALPIKFKAPDLSSTASQVAVEELQFVHEGLDFTRPEGGS